MSAESSTVVVGGSAGLEVLELGRIVPNKTSFAKLAGVNVPLVYPLGYTARRKTAIAADGTEGVVTMSIGGDVTEGEPSCPVFYIRWSSATDGSIQSVQGPTPTAAMGAFSASTGTRVPSLPVKKWGLADPAVVPKLHALPGAAEVLKNHQGRTGGAAPATKTAPTTDATVPVSSRQRKTLPPGSSVEVPAQNKEQLKATETSDDACPACHLAVAGFPFCAITGKPHQGASASSKASSTKVSSAGGQKRGRAAAPAAVDDDDAPLVDVFQTGFQATRGPFAEERAAATGKDKKCTTISSSSSRTPKKAKGKQPTLDSLVALATSSSSTAAATGGSDDEPVVVTAVNSAPSKSTQRSAPPKPPRRALPRPLLDKAGAKVAHDQLMKEGPGALGAPFPAVLPGGISEAQVSKYLEFVFEHGGERLRSDLLKRHRLQGEKKLTMANAGKTAVPPPAAADRCDDATDASAPALNV